MQRLTWLATVLCGASLARASWCAEPEAKPEDEAGKTWVAIETEGGSGKLDYMGRIEKRVLDEILSGLTQKGFIKLEHAFWRDDDGNTVRQDEWTDQPGYGNALHVRVDTIVRIVPLKKEYIEQMRKELFRPARPVGKIVPPGDAAESHLPQRTRRNAEDGNVIMGANAGQRQR